MIENDNEIYYNLQLQVEHYLKKDVTDLQSDTIYFDYNKFLLRYKPTNLKKLDLIEEPTEDIINKIISYVRSYVKEHYTKPLTVKPPEVRFYNLPEKLNTTITNIGAERIGKLISVTGTIIALDTLKTDITEMGFICKDCDFLLTIEQPTNTNNTVYPSVCPECGGRYFKEDESRNKLKDIRQIILEETDTEKSHQERIKLVVEGKLSKEIDINQEVEVIGIASRDQTKKRIKESIIKVNNIILQKDKTVKLTTEDTKKLTELSKNENILEILTNSLAPNIILDPEIKTALLCYLVKGIPTGQIVRDNIHVLFIADPSTAKSRIGNYIIDFTNKYTKANGTSSTGVGLIGAVVKEPLLNTNVLELGAFPRANNGHCIIDEFDKLNSEEANILLDSMESGYTTIHKAGVHKEGIETKVSVLALANPKYGRFNPFKPIKEQITFYEALLSRFDLIFLLEDKPNIEKDKKIAKAILSEEILEENTGESITQIDSETLKKYIEYARSITPKLNKRAKEHAEEYYTTIRNNSDNTENVLSYDTRMFEALIRIASAIAKLKLSTEITNTEIEEATKLIDYCLNTLGQNPETSEIDIDRFRGNYDNSDKRNRDNILEAISVLNRETVDNGVKQRELLLYVEDNYNISRNTFYDTIKQLETHKDILIKTSSSRGKPKVIYLNN